MIRVSTLGAFTLATILPVTASAQDGVAIRISAGQVEILGVITDNPANPTARDFLAALPLDVPMTRLREREYYGRLPKALSSDGPRQEGFANGDIGYTAKSHYFAVFYDNSRDPEISDLIVIGRMTSDLSVFEGLAPDVTFRLERAGDE